MRYLHVHPVCVDRVELHSKNDVLDHERGKRVDHVNALACLEVRVVLRERGLVLNGERFKRGRVDRAALLRVVAGELRVADSHVRVSENKNRAPENRLTLAKLAVRNLDDRAGRQIHVPRVDFRRLSYPPVT